jgi:hypothetical protein
VCPLFTIIHYTLYTIVTITRVTISIANGSVAI